jgi:lipooligosaccharide transport system permease protein
MGDSTWPVLARFEWARIYYGQAAAPPRPGDILDGHLAFVLFRTVLSSAAFLVIAAAFGTLHSWWALATLPIGALVGLAVAAPTFAFASSIRSDSYLAILFRVGMIPMSLFSGVFFPVASLPVLLRWVAYVFPLWHGVDLSRAAMLGRAPGWAALTVHLLVLLAWCAAGWFLAHRRFRRRLVI